MAAGWQPAVLRAAVLRADVLRADVLRADVLRAASPQYHDLNEEPDRK